MNQTAYSGRMLEPNELARRFGIKPGFRLIDCVQVALPIFVIPIEAIVIASKPLPLVDEFLLRSISEGVDTVRDLSGFLGLDTVFVTKRLGELVGQDILAYAPEGGGQARASLTSKGKTAVQKVMVVQPKRESFEIAIDGITQLPLVSRPKRLIAARDARALGLVEIRAFPVDKAPEFGEVAGMNLTAAVIGGSKREKSIERVMSLVNMGRRLRRFQEATMLVFRAEAGKQISVEFVIDGRPSPSVTEAFARFEGVKALHIPEKADASLAETEAEVKTVLPDLIGTEKSQQVSANRPKLLNDICTIGNLEAKIEETAIEIEEARSRDETESLKAKYAKLQIEKAAVEQELNSIEIRYVEVHEHRQLFEKCLSDSTDRLLIVSPWVRDSVLNRLRLDRLRRLVEKGVKVYIGYGLGVDDKPGKDKGEQAIEFLSRLSVQYSNFRFCEFGDTHAKIVLVDDSFAVVGSFNWLSFDGDPRRDFREEISLRINKKDEIERLFQRYLVRFQKKTDGRPTNPSQKFTNSLEIPDFPITPRPATQSRGDSTNKPTAKSTDINIQGPVQNFPPSAATDGDIITLKQFAEEVKKPLSEVILMMKQQFPHLAEGAKVNRAKLLPHWDRLSGNPRKVVLLTRPEAVTYDVKKGEVERERDLSTPTSQKPGVPPVRKKQEPVLSCDNPGATPVHSVSPTPAKPAVLRAGISVKKTDVKSVVTIQALANHLGVPVERVVSDLGWGKLMGTDVVIANSHVVRLCRQYQRPLPPW